MKQISLLVATTPSSPAPDLPSEPDDLGAAGWVVEDSGTLFNPGILRDFELFRAGRVGARTIAVPKSGVNLRIGARRPWLPIRGHRLPSGGAGRSFESAAPLPAVARQRVLDDRERGLGRLDLVDLDNLPLELRVILEESPQHHQPV